MHVRGRAGNQAPFVKGISVQVLLQFAIDDTAGGENEDALTEIGFYVPKEAASFQDGQEPPAKVGDLQFVIHAGLVYSHGSVRCTARVVPLVEARWFAWNCITILPSIDRLGSWYAGLA